MKYENGIKIEEGNIVDYIKELRAHVFLHVVNCQCTMNSGVARALRDAFPKVYEVDEKTKKGDYNKLGTISIASLEVNRYDVFVINMYAQFEYGREKRQLDYDAFAMCLNKVSHYFPHENIIYPYLMGCDRAGGDWEIVSELLRAKLKNNKHFAVRLPQ